MLNVVKNTRNVVKMLLKTQEIRNLNEKKRIKNEKISK